MGQKAAFTGIVPVERRQGMLARIPVNRPFGGLYRIITS
jgi:hypothetical protein